MTWVEDLIAQRCLVGGVENTPKRGKWDFVGATVADDPAQGRKVITVSPTTGVFDVRAMGADPTGVTDATAIFQAAIDAADPGGLVYVPAGSYRLNLSSPTTLTLKPGVTITGPQRGMKQGNQIFAGALAKDGALLNVYGTGKLFTMKQQSHAANLCLYYPNQQTNATPDVYDYAFYMGANDHGCSLQNITAINPYRFAYVNIGGCLIENVIAGPLNRGITLARVPDVARIHNVHFNVGINAANNGSTLIEYVQQNLRAFVVDGAEEFSFTDCFVVICLLGLCFDDEDADNFPSYGNWKGGGIDYAVGCVQVLDGMALSTLRMSDVSFIATPTSTPVVGAGNVVKMQDAEASPTHKPTVFLDNFTVHGEHSRDFWLDGNSNGHIIASRGKIEGTVNQVALAEKAVDGYKGGVIQLDHCGAPSTAAARIQGPGNVSERHGWYTDKGAIIDSDGASVGALLANADATITIAGGAWRIIAPKTLTANRTIDIDNGAELDGETITVDRQDIEAFTVQFRDNGDTNIPGALMPASTKMRMKFRKAAGGNFVLEETTRLT